MRVLVCGGRDFTDATLVASTLTELVPPGATIVHGAAPGAEFLAAQWALARGMRVEAIAADWRKQGREGFGQFRGPL